MVATVIALGVALVVAVGELLHQARVRKVARLAFGPGSQARPWTAAAGPLRVVAAGAIAWGLVTLLQLEPRAFQAERAAEGEEHHVVLVLDVSPSMRLEDAGPGLEDSRLQRVSALLQSFFKRVPVDRFKVSVVAVYTGAKAVVVDTEDLEVIRNILDDLPMHYAFQAGKTELFAGLEQAAELARPWNPDSAVVVVLSDGDTVPASGMPEMPPSVRTGLVVGVGDSSAGKWIDGKQSRQDVGTLRQIATRLRGDYTDGNQRHIPSDTIVRALGDADASPLERLTKREYALLAVGCGSLLLALLPLLLSQYGSGFPAGAPRWRDRAEHVSAGGPRA